MAEIGVTHPQAKERGGLRATPRARDRKDPLLRGPACTWVSDLQPPGRCSGCLAGGPVSAASGAEGDPMAWQPGGRPGAPSWGHITAVSRHPVSCLMKVSARHAEEGRGMLDPPAASAPPKPSRRLRKSAWPAGAPGGTARGRGRSLGGRRFLYPQGPEGCCTPRRVTGEAQGAPGRGQLRASPGKAGRACCLGQASLTVPWTPRCGVGAPGRGRG